MRVRSPLFSALLAGALAVAVLGAAGSVTHAAGNEREGAPTATVTVVDDSTTPR
ncbi:hypothetical protein V2W30_21275 [Streptomyces sp. Q6]|uniref:Uncharacterized protein n=1 Tax=Streptomyces citrinus TaxID=3118173 RepID=A0ACD5AET4_9ACTN